ncbi:AAA family ATPase [Nitratireductor aquimarinus]|uniref:AAA family ATPase n=1 Tax=Alphaproteobacteria TaxID=28211 RepID=UPI0019D33760|nr:MULTISPECIES: AAA family ATPase [Alphaproteobacteria]MBN7757690.1 AAA family ATPase [Nitratireductor aquimarinus]MBY6000453.1 AAA family ATPase [Tritonibacter mobilis]MBY6022481.1 AAA family ATPase [Nitratireductor sp. DP7N14-4]
MILDEIRLQDFRCFYGECKIEFSTNKDKNVTLIYAENGVGKTTLLNALLWCFYGETTSRFEKKEDILNYDAKKEGRSLAMVEVLFEHNGSHYIAKRFFRGGNASDDGRTFVVARFDRGGQVDISSPDTFINTVIPRDMAAHFLFDGEHAEVFLGEKNRASIRGAVRDILGCSLIETAIDDLQAISSQFRKQIPSTPATKKIEELNNRMDALGSQIDAAREEIARLEKSRRLTEEQIGDIDTKLRNTAAAKELQRSRERLTEQMRRVEKRQKEASDEVYKWLGENGRFIVSKKITEETFDFLNDESHRGRIPSPYNEEFVKDVLEAETCICGAHLTPGSEAAKKVAKLLERAANQVMRDRIAKVRGRLSSLKSERAKAPNRLVRAKGRLAEANEEFASIEAQLGEIHDKLKGINFGDIAAREERREGLRKELSEIDRSIGAFGTGISNAERERAQIDRDINALAQQDNQTAIYAKRRNLCESIKGTLELQLVEEENLARKVLRAGIKKILEATTRKALNLCMSDDYGISLVNSDGITLPKSSGENQLLGLAFTAALVEFAKIRENAQDYKLLPGTIAPLVLDSPFGQLDESYRHTTAEFIPKMSRQVVLLLSRSQGSEEVLSALQNHIGAEYLLVRHNRDPIGERKPESRYFKGEEYRTAVFDSDYDGTEIVKVAAA